MKTRITYTFLSSIPFWIVLVLSIVFINSNAAAQQTHTVSFETSDGIYGHAVIKTAPRSMGAGYIVIDSQRLVYEGVRDNSQLSGITFPLTAQKYTIDLKGSGCMRLNSQTPDCGSFSMRSLSHGPSDYTEVAFSESAKQKHNDIRKETGEEIWINQGFAQNIIITEVRGDDLNSIRKAINAASEGETTESQEVIENEQGSEEEAQQSTEEAQPIQQKKESTVDRQNREETERQRQAQAEEERRKKEQEEKQRKQREYDAWKDKAERENQALAASSAATSSAFLYLLGGMIYGDMGVVAPEKVYTGNNLYLGVDFGYSSSFTPMFFNSDYQTMSGGNSYSSQSIKDSYALTVNFDVNVKFGYEQEYVGGYAYYYPQFGFSPIFDTYSLSYKRFGGRAFGGINELKIYYDYTQGDRYMYKFDYLDPEESGDGELSHNYRRNEFGLRISYNSDAFIRNHIYLGLIYEYIMNYKSGAEIYSQVQNIDENLSGVLVPRNQHEDQIMTGYTFQWKKDQHFNFYVNLFPKYPFTGDLRYGIESDFNDGNPGFFIELGYIRSIDSWF